MYTYIILPLVYIRNWPILLVLPKFASIHWNQKWFMLTAILGTFHQLCEKVTHNKITPLKCKVLNIINFLRDYFSPLSVKWPSVSAGQQRPIPFGSEECYKWLNALFETMWEISTGAPPSNGIIHAEISVNVLQCYVHGQFCIDSGLSTTSNHQ